MRLRSARSPLEPLDLPQQGASHPEQMRRVPAESELGAELGMRLTISLPMRPAGLAFGEKSPHSLFDVVGWQELAKINLLRAPQRCGKTRKRELAQPLQRHAQNGAALTEQIRQQGFQTAVELSGGQDAIDQSNARRFFR